MRFLKATFSRVVIAAALVMEIAPAVRGQCELGKLRASDGSAGDWFAYSVGISGDWAVVGSRRDDDKGPDSGSAYIFHFEGSQWVQAQKIHASDGFSGDQFGWSVAMDGETVVIGAPYDDDRGSNSGAAYVFSYDDSSWVQVEKLLADDGAANDLLGQSVAVSKNNIVIGAHFDDNARGSAYVFRYKNRRWQQDAKLMADDRASIDEFGQSVAIAGDLALIGAYGDDDKGSWSGSAYVFRKKGNKWKQEQKLVADDGSADDQFSWSSVAISGDMAVVGSWLDDDNGGDSGAAYVYQFDESNWVQKQKLLPADNAAGDTFGTSAALSGNQAVIGAMQLRSAGPGWAYLFGRKGSSWVQAQKLVASDGANGDSFGWSVAMSDDPDAPRALVGARDDDGKVGSAYVFAVGYGLCNGREQLKLRCTPIPNKPNSRLVAKVKRGLPGGTLTLRVDDKHRTDKPVTMDCNGRGKVKFRRKTPPGMRAVEIVECGASEQIECP